MEFSKDFANELSLSSYFIFRFYQLLNNDLKKLAHLLGG